MNAKSHDLDVGGPDLADAAAPLDALLVDAALGPVRRFAPDLSSVKLAASLARQPLATAQRLGSLAAEARRITIGTSSGVTGPARPPVRRRGLVAEPRAAQTGPDLPGRCPDGRAVGG